MKIVVTGGAGFIASHVVDRYLQLGHDVCVVDNLSRGSMTNLDPRATFYQGDILDREFIHDVLAREKPEVVNHHAAQIDVRRAVCEPSFDASVNILGSLNLLEGAVLHKVRRFIFISTAGAIYGEPKKLPVPETHPANPITPYGVSKHAAEHYLDTFSRLYGIASVVLRYGNVYGPRQNPRGEVGVFSLFCEQIMASIQPLIYGNGMKTRDYIYIEDVVRANVAALDKGSGETFNIASGIETTDYQLFCVVRNLLGKSHVEPLFVSKRPGEIDKICLNISKANRLLNWKPTVPLQDGASLTIKYIQEQSATQPARTVGCSPGTNHPDPFRESKRILGVR